MNVWTGVGRCGRDAVTRFTANGKPVTGWSLAVDSGFGDNKQTTWFDCTLWGERGQKIAEYIRKGDRLGVTGEIATREHESKTYVTLKVNEVTLLGDKRDQGSTPQARTAPAAQSSPPVDDFEDSIPF